MLFVVLLHFKIIRNEAILIQDLLKSCYGPFSYNIMLSKNERYSSTFQKSLLNILKLNNPVCALLNIFYRLQIEIILEGTKTLLIQMCNSLKNYISIKSVSNKICQNDPILKLLFKYSINNLKKVSIYVDLTKESIYKIISIKLYKESYKNIQLKLICKNLLSFFIKHRSLNLSKMLDDNNLSIITINKPYYRNFKIFNGLCLSSKKGNSFPINMFKINDFIILEDDLNTLFTESSTTFLNKTSSKNNLYTNSNRLIQQLVIQMLKNKCNVIILKTHDLRKFLVDSSLSYLTYFDIAVIYGLEHKIYSRLKVFFKSMNLKYTLRLGTFNIHRLDKLIVFQNEKKMILKLKSHTNSTYTSILLINSFKDINVKFFIKKYISYLIHIFLHPLLTPSGGSYESFNIFEFNKLLHLSHIKQNSVIHHWNKIGYKLSIQLLIRNNIEILKSMTPQTNNNLSFLIQKLLQFQALGYSYVGYDSIAMKFCNVIESNIFELAFTKFTIAFLIQEFILLLAKIDDILWTEDGSIK